MVPLSGMYQAVRARLLMLLCSWLFAIGCVGAEPNPFASDSQQALERTGFQTSQPWSSAGNLRSDVAIAYGIGADLPARMQTWRDHGYRLHVMTGVSWGQYQDYLYGKFDGINHEDEAQTDRFGNKISHGGDVYYMCPGTNYGKFLCVGIQRALDAGAEAIHLEEPEFWVRGGYSEGFKREWQSYYGEPWQAPHSSVDAQWRASKLKYFLYRRALQQIFDYVQDYNRRAGKKVRCYVPTHSLLNYAHWNIVSPESSLARLKGCDGYIAQVWTGTARTANMYRGNLRERTFETAFLEYAAMQNLVRSTGRAVWYLNDPVEDNGNHDWKDYRGNWESTLVASLLQPEVCRYEVAPWPERVFNGRYPRRAPRDQREGIPPTYATELQTVMNALNNMNQKRVQWDCGTTGVGLLASDSLMFERGEPAPSEAHLGHVYGLTLPLLKRGIPVTPVQLENLTVPGYLSGFKIVFLSYQGMKPLSPEVHDPLAKWVKAGGCLVVVDDDSDPFNKPRDWWNTGDNHFRTPREHLFKVLGLQSNELRNEDGAGTEKSQLTNHQFKAGRGSVIWRQDNPARIAAEPQGDQIIAGLARDAAKFVHADWRETSYLALRRGPYLIGAGLDESIAGEPRELKGKFVDLFDPDLTLRDSVRLEPGTRFLLLDLESSEASQAPLLASACKCLAEQSSSRSNLSFVVEGVGDTPAIVLLRCKSTPRSVTLEGNPLDTFDYVPAENMLRIRFENRSSPRQLQVRFQD